jgi:hypothetical protein
VLNKWDRCNTGESGVRPDDDLLADLKAEGFEKPLLFRTTAQLWLDASQKSGGNGLPPKPPDLPDGEQFALLRNWLELGITRLEIEAVKARGVGQLLAHIGRAAADVRPPDLTAEAEKVRAAWEKTARRRGRRSGRRAGRHAGAVPDRGRAPLQRREPAAVPRADGRVHAGHDAAAVRRQRAARPHPARGLKGKLLGGRVDTPVEWNLGAFVQECARTAGERVLDQRTTALVNRLLVDAEAKGFPLTLLSDPGRRRGAARLAREGHRAVIEALAEVERHATTPPGSEGSCAPRSGALANSLPEVALVATVGTLLWNFFVREPSIVPDFFQMSLVVLIPLVVIIALHFLILLLLPVRWPAIRSEFRAQLGARMGDDWGARTWRSRARWRPPSATSGSRSMPWWARRTRSNPGSRSASRRRGSRELYGK